MSKGKIAAQASHASLEAALKTQSIDKTFKRNTLDTWRREGAKKVVLKVANDKELIQIRDKAAQQGFATALIKDAGHTELPAGTITAIAIGPDDETKLDKITGHLQML